MKTKTLKLTAILLILAGVFTSCEEKNEPFLNIDKTTITATAEGGIFQIAVSSNGNWTAIVQDAEDNSWLTLTDASGINNGVITVNIAENTFYATRSTTVLVSMGSLSRTVAITQEPNKSFPRDIPFTHASIRCPMEPDTQGCFWKPLAYYEFPEFLTSVIISSDEELEKHIWCWPGYYLDTAFYFSKYTLLRVVVGSKVGGVLDNISFRQYSENLYKLYIKIVHFCTVVWIPPWDFKLLTNKLSEGSEIKINVTKYFVCCTDSYEKEN